VSCDVAVSRIKGQLSKKIRRSLDKLDTSKFVSRLDGSMANPPMSDNVNTYCTSLQSSIWLALDELVPLQTIRGFNKANLHFPLTTEAMKANIFRRWRERRLGPDTVACRRATRLIHARSDEAAISSTRCYSATWAALDPRP